MHPWWGRQLTGCCCYLSYGILPPVTVSSRSRDQTRAPARLASVYSPVRCAWWNRNSACCRRSTWRRHRYIIKSNNNRSISAVVGPGGAFERGTVDGRVGSRVLSGRTIYWFPIEQWGCVVSVKYCSSAVDDKLCSRKWFRYGWWVKISGVADRTRRRKALVFWMGVKHPTK